MADDWALSAPLLRLGPGRDSANARRVPVRSSQTMAPDADGGTTDHVAHLVQSIAAGDWENDTGPNPGFAFGLNVFTCTGASAGDGNNLVALYGGLIEAAVRSPSGTIDSLIAFEAEASFQGASAGMTVNVMKSMQVGAPVRKDGATAGTATTVYGLYVEKVDASYVGASTAYSARVAGGVTRIDGQTEHWSGSLTDVPLQVRGYPSQTGNLVRVMDYNGNNKARVDAAGVVAAANSVVAFEGDARKVVAGAGGPSNEAGVRFGSTGTTGLWRAASGVIATDAAVRLLAVATGSRPSASAAGAGATIFDTTLGKPIWSNGTNWVDATGTTV